MKHLKILLTLTLLPYSSLLFSQTATPTVPDTSEIYTAVEHMPSYPGGEVAFGKLLRENITYPEKARVGNVQGRVFLAFVVERDGSLSNIKVMREPGSGLGEEAVRVLKLSPKWNPGTQNGVNVKVKYVIPVTFNLSIPSAIPSSAYTSFSVQPKYPPVFPGGPQALNAFFKANVRYTDEAKKAQIAGRVFTEFFVEPDGSLSDIKLLYDHEKDLGAEAIRMLKLSPKWKPGISEYKNADHVTRDTTRTLVLLPIDFTLSDVKVYEIRTTQDSIDNHQIFYAVDTNPAFPGGEEAFGQFLTRYIRYPDLAKKRNVTGKTFIQFVVEESGELTHICILRNPGYGLGEESARIINLSPKWIAGIKKGQKVRVQYTVPINYSLAE